MKYLDLIKAALWGGQATWPEEETEQLMRLNAQQGTGALVYPMVLEQTDLSAQTRAQMKGVCVQIMQQQTKLQYTLAVAWNALEQAGIHGVLLKGAGLAAFYPEPQRRSWGDVDIFAGKEQYHAACAALRAAFPKALTFDEELEHYKHYNLIADGVSIELHRVTVSLQHPLDARRYSQMERIGMEQAERMVIDGLEVRVPEPTFNMLFVFLHAWEHMISGGANVRQLCDVALMMHHYADRIDRVRFKRWLKALHLDEVWEIYACIAVNDLGLPQEEALFYTEQAAERAEQMMADLLKGAEATGHKEEAKPARNRWVRKYRTMKERFETAQRIKRYSPSYARHMNITTILHGAGRLFAKDRRWE